jgi:hypothetical protein
MEETMEQYITQMIEDGYITEKGEPLKCVHCGSKDLESHHFYENHYVAEIDVICKICDKNTGHWSYGSWCT